VHTLEMSRESSQSLPPRHPPVTKLDPSVTDTPSRSRLSRTSSPAGCPAAWA
jgi:hypothetical protein